MTLPRPEYPRPILERNEWLSLNGRWQFQADPNNFGLKEGWFNRDSLESEILVPFPIESEAPGVHNLEPDKVNWYQRTFTVPEAWQDEINLNIGACDHRTTVFINGQQVGEHRGGYTPITINITHALVSGDNRVTIRVADDIGWTQARGRQAGTTKWPIDYDTVTGIWQTVWLEPLNATHLIALHSQYNADSSELTIWFEANQQNSLTVQVSVLVDGECIVQQNCEMNERSESRCTLQIPEPKLWSPDSPYLYDLNIELLDQGHVVDSTKSYVVLREIGHNGEYFTLNREPVYLRGILDQGYFQEGWYSPLNDAAIKQDIELTLAMGFNLARKHQKIEDPRYLYWADKLGLMVWAEMPSGRVFSNELIRDLTQEWSEVIKRDRQHPCIVAWVPFNESWGVWHQIKRPEQRALVDALVHLTKAYDSSRLVIGNDGWEFSSGDMWTLHLYEGETQSLSDRLDNLIKDPQSYVTGGENDGRVGALSGAVVDGLPIILTECGGIGFVRGEQKGDEFAYGDLPTTEQALETQFRQVAKIVNETSALKGFVWTQLTDVQQEINGVLYFNREPKLPVGTIKEIMMSIG